VNPEDFFAVVESAVNVRSGGGVGTTETFCSLTTESSLTVGAPAALSVVISSSDHRARVRTSCSFPASVAEVTAVCDDVLPLSSYRRFCPCVDQEGCDGRWYVGYSGDSCEATCTSAGGECDAEPLATITTSDAFSTMVASATVVETNERIGESSEAFCQHGINILPFATAPSVITLNIGAVNETLCVYPTSTTSLQGSCDVSFTDPPAQRFCNCKQVPVPLPSQRRALLSSTAFIGITEPATDFPAKKTRVTPRLRGNLAAFEG